MLRYLTAGESHGPTEVAILEGIPAGLELSEKDIQKDLDRRKGGSGRGGRGHIETDQVRIVSGVRGGKTIGAPIALLVDNLDYTNWKSKETSNTNPRPGHADLAGTLKYHFSDIRNVLERASARETVMRVAAGAVCKKLIELIGVKIESRIISIGQVSESNQMEKEILTAIKNKDTLGGIVEITAHNVPVGLGSHVHYDRKIDGQIAQHLMSIPSVKAVEIGEGIENASKFGSGVQDEIYFENNRFKRRTNRAGGIEGGITNGENIICRVYHKPLSTLGIPLNSVDIKTKKSTKAFIERSDVCVIPRAGVISEAAVAFVVAMASMEKFGSDTVCEFLRNYEGYVHTLTTI